MGQVMSGGPNTDENLEDRGEVEFMLEGREEAEEEDGDEFDNDTLPQLPNDSAAQAVVAQNIGSNLFELHPDPDTGLISIPEHIRNNIHNIQRLEELRRRREEAQIRRAQLLLFLQMRDFHYMQQQSGGGQVGSGSEPPSNFPIQRMEKPETETAQVFTNSMHVRSDTIRIERIDRNEFMDGPDKMVYLNVPEGSTFVPVDPWDQLMKVYYCSPVEKNHKGRWKTEEQHLTRAEFTKKHQERDYWERKEMPMIREAERIILDERKAAKKKLREEERKRKASSDLLQSGSENKNNGSQRKDETSGDENTDSDTDTDLDSDDEEMPDDKKPFQYSDKYVRVQFELDLTEPAYVQVGFIYAIKKSGGGVRRNCNCAKCDLRRTALEYTRHVQKRHQRVVEAEYEKCLCEETGFDHEKRDQLLAQLREYHALSAESMLKTAQSLDADSILENDNDNHYDRYVNDENWKRSVNDENWNRSRNDENDTANNPNSNAQSGVTTGSFKKFLFPVVLPNPADVLLSSTNGEDISSASDSSSNIGSNTQNSLQNRTSPSANLPKNNTHPSIYEDKMSQQYRRRNHLFVPFEEVGLRKKFDFLCECPLPDDDVEQWPLEVRIMLLPARGEIRKLVFDEKADELEEDDRRRSLSTFEEQKKLLLYREKEAEEYRILYRIMLEQCLEERFGTDVLNYWLETEKTIKKQNKDNTRQKREKDRQVKKKVNLMRYMVENIDKENTESQKKVYETIQKRAREEAMIRLRETVKHERHSERHAARLRLLTKGGGNGEGDAIIGDDEGFSISSSSSSFNTFCAIKKEVDQEYDRKKGFDVPPVSKLLESINGVPYREMPPRDFSTVTLNEQTQGSNQPIPEPSRPSNDSNREANGESNPESNLRIHLGNGYSGLIGVTSSSDVLNSNSQLNMSGIESQLPLSDNLSGPQLVPLVEPTPAEITPNSEDLTPHVPDILEQTSINLVSTLINNVQQYSCQEEKDEKLDEEKWEDDQRDPLLPKSLPKLPEKLKAAEKPKESILKNAPPLLPMLGRDDHCTERRRMSGITALHLMSMRSYLSKEQMALYNRCDSASLVAINWLLSLELYKKCVELTHEIMIKCEGDKSDPVVGDSCSSSASSPVGSSLAGKLTSDEEETTLCDEENGLAKVFNRLVDLIVKDTDPHIPLERIRNTNAKLEDLTITREGVMQKYPHLKTKPELWFVPLDEYSIPAEMTSWHCHTKQCFGQYLQIPTDIPTNFHKVFRREMLDQDIKDQISAPQLINPSSYKADFNPLDWLTIWDSREIYGNDSSTAAEKASAGGHQTGFETFRREGVSPSFASPSFASPSKPYYNIDGPNINMSNVDSECIICFSERRSIIFMPCRHLCLCDECATTLTSKRQFKSYRCPICRHKVSRFVRVEESVEEQGREERVWKEKEQKEKKEKIAEDAGGLGIGDDQNCEAEDRVADIVA